MAELFYYKSTNDFFLIESKKVGTSTHHYYECVYSNGLDEILLSQSVSKKIPTLISFNQMQRIFLNDKNIETPEYFT
jgi:hypothetical protein